MRAEKVTGGIKKQFVLNDRPLNSSTALYSMWIFCVFGYITLCSELHVWCCGCIILVWTGTATALRQTQIRLPPFSTWDTHTLSRSWISVLYYGPICSFFTEHWWAGLISEKNGLFPHCRHLLVIHWTDCSFALASGTHMLLFLSFSPSISTQQAGPEACVLML